jgi:hypothetical protein
VQQIERTHASLLREEEATTRDDQARRPTEREGRKMNGSSATLARSRRNAIGALLTMALLGTACSSTSPTSAPSTQPPSETAVDLPGCIPGCGETDMIEPGELPEGEYQTEWFFGGEMRLTFDDAGWTSKEDSTGEFQTSPPGAPDNDILFWEDVYPVRPPGGATTWTSGDKPKRIKGVPLTVAGLLGWMRSSSQLDVSAPTHGAIGDLPATVVDVRVADDALDEEPEDCPSRACVNFIGFPQWDGAWGLAYPARFYLSDVTYGGRDHLFVVAIYPADPTDTETLGSAERLISTVHVAASPG